MTATEETQTTPPIYQELAKLLGHPDTYAEVALDEYVREQAEKAAAGNAGAMQQLANMPKPKPPARRKGVRNPKTPA